MTDLHAYIVSLLPPFLELAPEPEPPHPDDQERDEDPPEVFADPVERAIASFRFVSFGR